MLVDTFLKGAATAGAEVERFDLVNLAINQCRGCFRKCILKPGYRCGTFRDDMDMLLREMVSSDLMLFASPYYCASYTAIMARFLERSLPLWEVEVVGELGSMNAFRFLNRPLKGKKAVIGLVQDFKDPATARPAITAFRHDLCHTYMMNIVHKIHVTDVRDAGDIMKKGDVLEKIYAAGRRLARTQR